LSPGLEGSRRVLLVGRARATARVITGARLALAAAAAARNVGVDGGAIVSGTGTGLGDAAGRGRLGRVGSLGVLSAAGVVLTARGSALHVALAALDALVAPFGADKVGERQGVLGDVGLEAIATDAAVGESFLDRILVKWPSLISEYDHLQGCSR
jgi:hypothetical protein